MILYPIISQRLNNQSANEIIPELWQKHGAECGGQTCYAVYCNYQSDYKGDYDFAICTENPSVYEPIEITDFTFYEIFRCSSAQEVYSAWQSIWRKEQQGLLKRAYTVDFEKYQPDGKVEIYIAVVPHC